MNTYGGVEDETEADDEPAVVLLLRRGEGDEPEIEDDELEDVDDEDLVVPVANAAPQEPYCG